jgi:hypothetical protein
MIVGKTNRQRRKRWYAAESLPAEGIWPEPRPHDSPVTAGVRVIESNWAWTRSPMTKTLFSPPA